VVGDAPMSALGVAPVHDLQAALAAADVITLHVPLLGRQPLIGVAELARMKPTALLVNTARGGLIDEAALAAALAEGRLGGAGIDVLADEPPAPNHPLLASGRAILTPHTAGLSQESALRMSVSSVQNVLDFFAGRLDAALVVNRPKQRNG